MVKVWTRVYEPMQQQKTLWIGEIWVDLNGESDISVDTIIRPRPTNVLSLAHLTIPNMAQTLLPEIT